MDEKNLSEAVENISIIKEVIDKTNKSFTGFSKIFIYWGILFIVNSIFFLGIYLNKDAFSEIFNRFPIVNYIFPVGVIALIAALIYRNVSKRMPLVSFEKHLMKMWMLILIMNVIPSKISISSPPSSGVNISSVVVQTSTLSITLFSLAIALIVTGLFAGYRQPIIVGTVYIGLSLIHAYTRLPIFESSLFQVLNLLLLPFTFLYTGFYLKTKQSRRKQLGYKLST